MLTVNMAESTVLIKRQASVHFFSYSVTQLIEVGTLTLNSRRLIPQAGVLDLKIIIIQFSQQPLALSTMSQP